MAQPNNDETATTKAEADGIASQSNNKFLHEKMESTLRKAREKVKEVQQDVDSERFDKAWERVYGSKHYRPSWIGKLQNRGSPARNKQHLARTKKQEPVEEEKKEKEKDEDLGPSQTEGYIPEQFRNKKAFDPLKIKGEIVPTEQALEKWRIDIDTGEVANNKIVKETNVSSWIDSNHFWKSDKDFLTAKPVKKKALHSQKPPENQKIIMEKYDLVGKYEHRVHKDSLKIGSDVVPQEGDLKKWGAGLEIPDDLTAQDFSLSPTSGRRVPTTGKESEGRKKWNNVLETADVPNFLAYNGYW